MWYAILGNNRYMVMSKLELFHWRKRYYELWTHILSRSNSLKFKRLNEGFVSDGLKSCGLRTHAEQQRFLLCDPCAEFTAHLVVCVLRPEVSRGQKVRWAMKHLKSFKTSDIKKSIHHQSHFCALTYCDGKPNLIIFQWISCQRRRSWFILQPTQMTCIFVRKL